jgi:hypothetical protein
MATQRKRKAPRASFVTTVAAASALAFAALPGCGTTVSAGCPGEQPAYGSSCSDEGQVCGYGSDGCGNPLEIACQDGAWGYAETVASCNPPPPELCPDDLPAPTDSCPALGASCEYPGDGGCIDGYQATCEEDGKWFVVVTDHCQEPECPAEMPAPGEPCPPSWEASCPYTVDTGCGPMEAQATCVDGIWLVDTPTCNPPPPEYCTTLATEADCGANQPFCRWLVPGCADPGTPPPPLAQAGCFPSFDCASSADCQGEAICQEVVYDPCYNKGCDACGAVASLCVGP